MHLTNVFYIAKAVFYESAEQKNIYWSEHFLAWEVEEVILSIEKYTITFTLKTLLVHPKPCWTQRWLHKQVQVYVQICLYFASLGYLTCFISDHRYWTLKTPGKFVSACRHFYSLPLMIAIGFEIEFRWQNHTCLFKYTVNSNLINDAYRIPLFS